MSDGSNVKWWARRRYVLLIAVVVLIALWMAIQRDYRSQEADAKEAVGTVATDLRTQGFQLRDPKINDQGADFETAAEYSETYRLPSDTEQPICTDIFRKLSKQGYRFGSEDNQTVDPAQCRVGNDKTPDLLQRGNVLVRKDGKQTVVRWNGNLIIVSNR